MIEIATTRLCAGSRTLVRANFFLSFFFVYLSEQERKTREREREKEGGTKKRKKRETRYPVEISSIYKGIGGGRSWRRDARVQISFPYAILMNSRPER